MVSGRESVSWRLLDCVTWSLHACPRRGGMRSVVAVIRLRNVVDALCILASFEEVITFRDVVLD